MKPLMRFSLLALLLAVTVTFAEDDSFPADESEEPKTIPSTASKTDSKNPTNTLVGQSTFGGLLPGMDMFALTLPMLMQLSSFGNGFQIPQLLGQHQQPQQHLDTLTDASKVVLVTADDLQAANSRAFASRVPRQSGAGSSGGDFFSNLQQSLGPGLNLNLGEGTESLLGAPLSQMQQSLTQGLQQGLQQFGGPDTPLLAQIRQAIPTQIPGLQQLDLSQFSQIQQLLGATIGPGGRLAGVSLGQGTSKPSSSSGGSSSGAGGSTSDGTTGTDTSAGENGATVAQNTPAQSVQQQASQIVGSAFANLPNTNSFQEMLGSALPNIQNAFSGFLNNDAARQNLDAAASDIREIRVKPNATPEETAMEMDQRDMTHDDMKWKAALHDTMLKKSMPVLWFRMPELTAAYRAGHSHHQQRARPTFDDANLETNLKIFEREVISELRQLQKIDREANILRAMSGKSIKESSDRERFSLSRIPIHKITMKDIERTLADEYVAMLLRKAAMEKLKQKKTTKNDEMTVPVKRQTMANAQQQMSKEDMTKLLTHAYRMANEAKESSWGIAGSKNENDNTHERQWADQQSTMMNNDQQRQRDDQQQRQWADQQSTMKNTDHQRERNEKQQRQWADKQSTMMNNDQQRQRNDQQQRQWADQQSTMMNNDQQRQRDDHQHRQWADQQSTMKNTDHQHQRDDQQQRQWADQQSTMMNNDQQQRQWANQQTTMKKIEQQQRQWADHQHKMENKEQSPRQMADEQQKNMADEKMKRAQMVMRQWVDPSETPEQRQMSNPSMQIDEFQRQQQQQQPHMMMPDSPMMLQTLDPQQLLGEATPQMPQNADKARKGLLDELDLFDVGKKGGKEKGHSRHPTIINYYYSQGGYGGGYGGGSAGYGSNSGGYGVSGGYGGGQSMGYGGGSYGGGGYGSNAYGGGSYGSNAYGGSYRTATGDDEIQAMLREHNTMPATHFRI